MAMLGMLGIASADAQSTCPTVTPLPGTGQVTTTTNFYDAQGNKTQICDPRSTSSSQIYTTQAFDHLNRVTAVTQPIPGTSGSHPVIITGYDERDQVIKVADPGSLNTTYTIDGLGNLTLQSSPDTGSTTNTYDAFGNLKTSQDARLDTTTYSYDALNRVTKIAYASGTATGFTYDGGSAPVQYDIGHLTGISDESGSTRFYYDGFGRVLQKNQTTGSLVQSVKYTYSESGSTTGKLVSLTYPSGTQLEYTFDSAGRISSIAVTRTVSSNLVTQTLLSGITYSPFGLATGWAWGNGSSYSRTVDVDGRVASFPLGVLTSPVTTNGLERTLNYDGASRIQSMTHTDTSGSGTSSVALADNASFGYDNLNRLDAFAPSTTSQSYAYDLTGNRTSETVGATSYTYTPIAQTNQLYSTTGPSPARTNHYDQDGNLLTDGTFTYTYSARDRLASSSNGANTVTYLYNGLGQRVTKSGPTSLVTTGTNHYVYDESGHLLGEYDVNGNVISETVYLGDTPVVVLRTS